MGVLVSNSTPLWDWLKEQPCAQSTMIPEKDLSIIGLDFDEMRRWRQTFLGGKRLDRFDWEIKISDTRDEIWPSKNFSEDRGR